MVIASSSIAREDKRDRSFGYIERKNSNRISVGARLCKLREIAHQFSMCDIPKPKMRGLFAAQLRRNVIIAVTVAFCHGAAYKFLVGDRRKQQMRDYYL